MTDHFLRLKWMPADEAGLLQAYQGGLLAEKNWCDLKKALGSGKGANAELARDLASFAADGGTLIIGLDEGEPDGSPLTPVVLADVTPERIEQIAAMKVDPPLSVQCTTIESSQSGTGYVLVHVPASPLAPHQVEGKYLGRGDKTKRFLSDAEVAALIRRRDGWQASAERLLAEFAETDPFPRPGYPHLFILAQPVSQNRELFREVVGGSDYAARILKLMYDVSRIAPARSEIAGMTDLSKTADGVMVVPGNLGAIDPAALEKWTRRFEIREDGGLRYFNSHVGDWSDGPASDRILGLHLGLVLATFREVLALTLDLSQQHGFAGIWHLAILLTRIKGAQSLAAQPHGGPAVASWHRYTRPEYTSMASASVLEIQSNPGRVTERLLGRLVRSLTDVQPDQFND